MSKRVALALGGGGLRGAAHIGVLQFLSEQGVKFSCLTGTSAGSIAAGLFASGMSPEEMANWAKSIRPHDVFDFPGLGTVLDLGRKVALDKIGFPARLFRPPLGLIKGNRLEHVMKQLTKNALMPTLNIPTAIVATDIMTAEMVIFASPSLQEILRRRLPDSVVYSSVPVCSAIRASSAIPGIFVPKRIGRHILVDGCIQNNVPADLAAFSGADAVIAVDLGYSVLTAERINSALDVILQATDIMQYQITKNVLKYANAVIRPDTGEIGLTDFTRIPHLIEIGRKAARQAWPRISRLVA